MTRKSRSSQNIEKLRSMAKEYGCENNALFATAMDQYIVQQRIIDMIRDELDKSDLAVSKEYVKGRENVYAHPLVRELPKHSDSANRTAELLLKIITSVGSKKDLDDDGFDDFINGRDDP